MRIVSVLTCTNLTKRLRMTKKKLRQTKKQLMKKIIIVMMQPMTVAWMKTKSVDDDEDTATEATRDTTTGYYRC